jgi:hypothetical protein
MDEIYKPAPGKRIAMPGFQPDWPDDGRRINPLSAYELRLVADGDLVLVEDETMRSADKQLDAKPEVNDNGE